jgi:hypothetical protein
VTVWPASGFAAAELAAGEAGAAELDAAGAAVVAGAALADVLAALAAAVVEVAVDLLDDEHAATRTNAPTAQTVADDALVNRCDIGVSISGAHDQARSTLIRTGQRVVGRDAAYMS